MAAMGQYDSSLQMFVQTPREVDMTRLAFMRWLAESNRLEHGIYGPSSGPLVPEGALVKRTSEGAVAKLEGRASGSPEKR